MLLATSPSTSSSPARATHPSRQPLTGRVAPDASVLAAPFILRTALQKLPQVFVVSLTGLAIERRARRETRQRRSLLVCKALRRPADSADVPGNLFELFSVSPDAEPDVIKKAYYDKMKICHPDVAGEAGEEMCILLNEAYDYLKDDAKRKTYREKVVKTTKTAKIVLTDEMKQELEPYKYGGYGIDWKMHGKKTKDSDGKPLWINQPYSRSNHKRVPEAGRGEKWHEQQMVYVDEWNCICCRNCCDVAPQTFTIANDEAGRARAFAQWGNDEEYIDYAMDSCPVECIHWVSREELAAIEYVTRLELFETGGQMPCPMAARANGGGGPIKAFGMAEAWKSRLKSQEMGHRNKLLKGAEVNMFGRLGAGAFAGKMQDKISEIWGNLDEVLRQNGWSRP